MGPAKRAVETEDTKMAKTARIGTDERTRVMSPDIHDILHEKDTNDTHDTHDTQKNDSVSYTHLTLPTKRIV